MRMLILTAPDDSLSEYRIRKGDRIVIDCDAPLGDGDVILALLDEGELIVGRSPLDDHHVSMKVIGKIVEVRFEFN